MNLQMIFAGFGGQGVLLMGQLIAYAGMLLGKEVSWMPAYGPRAASRSFLGEAWGQRHCGQRDGDGLGVAVEGRGVFPRRKPLSERVPGGSKAHLRS